jgi:hypothetical protein
MKNRLIDFKQSELCDSLATMYVEAITAGLLQPWILQHLCNTE